MTGLIFEDIPGEMGAVVTNGNGGYDTLEYRQFPVRKPDEGAALAWALAAVSPTSRAFLANGERPTLLSPPSNGLLCG